MLIFLAGYALFLIGLGLYVSRRVSTSSDFFVAGRRLPAPLLFATFLAANLGAGTTVGAAEFGYTSGLSAWWWVGSAGLGSLVLAFFVGPKIYRIATKHNLYTVGDYLELRYSRAARLTMAALLWLGSLAILAGQLIALGLIFQVVAGLPTAWGCALGGVIVVIYFAAGGLVSSVWVNLAQVCVKAVGFSIALPWALFHVAGWDEITEFARQSSAVNPESYLSFTGIGFDGILSYAVILIPSFFVSPGLIQKLYGARDEGTIRRAVGWQGFVLLGYSFMPVLLGMIAFTQFPALENNGLALPMLLAKSFPVWIGGLMLAAIFSAEISSADAVLFMVSTSVARDLGQTVLRHDMSDRSLVGLTRIVAVVAGALGVALAIWLQSVLAALKIFYSLLSVALFVPLLAGLYSKRPTASAAVISMLVSVPLTFAVDLLTKGAGFGLATPALMGIGMSALIFVVFSARRGGSTSV